MTLTLSALSLNDQPLSQPLVAHFDHEGGTIGRGDQNTLTLPDPERHISRQHARVTAEAKGYRITNLSSANAVTVAGRTLGQGDSAAIRHRDLVRIGGFLLEVRDDSAEDPATRTITRGRAAVASEGVRTGGGPASPALTTPPPLPPAASAADDPFAEFFGPALARSPAPPPGPRAAGPAAPAAEIDPFLAAGFGAGPVGGAPAVGRDPFDFGPTPAPTPSPTSPLRPSGGARAGLPGDADLLGGLGSGPADAGGGSFDDLFAPGAADAGADLDAFLRQPLSPPPAAGGKPADAAVPADTLTPVRRGHSPAAGVPDHVPAIQAAFEAPRWSAPPLAAIPARAPEPTTAPTTAPIGPKGVPEDGGGVTAIFSARPPADPIPAARAAPEPHPAMATPFSAVAPRVALPGRRDAAPVSAPVSAPIAADDAALWQAFCEGAELRLPLPQGLSPELMRVIGQLLRSAVDGTQQMMAIRAATKHELRADVTMIQARHNNPLKFSPDAQAALEQLLQPPMRGFMAGPAAMTDAMHDLVGHTIGTMAGMRAALEGVLNRFSPGVLEGKLSGSSMLDALLPMNRRSRLWELYLQHFEAIRQEAQEDFHTLFGRAFLAAYEQQLDRLHEQQHQRAGSAARAPAAGTGSQGD